MLLRHPCAGAQENFHRNLRVVDELKLIAEKHHKKIPQLALRWVLQHPAVSVALVGNRSVQEVEDNMGALAWALSYRDREEIEAVFAKHDIDTSLDIWIDQP